ncbi:MAG: hypothetical protein H7Y20_11715 [Bryobacteraceae bacterium]|nr:hypothetical protein [Bryobacteraceae bacterium]
MEHELSLRACPSKDNQAAGWVVTGPSKEGGRRWKRFFLSREKAEAFLEQQRKSSGGEEASETARADAALKESTATRRKRKLRRASENEEKNEKWDRAVAEREARKREKRSREAFAVSSPRLLGIIVLICLASGIDRAVRYLGAEEKGEQLFISQFEANPLLSGWTTSGKGADWTTTEACSGSRSIQVQNATWISPLILARPREWYRITFQSKAPGSSSNPGGTGYGYCSVSFFDQTGSRVLSDFRSSVFPSISWETNELRVRALFLKDSNGRELPAKMRVRFTPIAGRPFFVDDLSIEQTTGAEVLAWSDAVYKKLPARLAYEPKATRWQRIPRTMAKLTRGEGVRIVMLGGRSHEELSHSPLDVLVKRRYPKSIIELITPVAAGTGPQNLKEQAAECVNRYRPDLLMIGDIDSRSSLRDIKQLIDQVRKNDLQTQRNTEMMFVTTGWSPNSIPPDSFLFSRTVRELDQVFENNQSIPSDFRGRLLRLAAANAIEYLDMNGIVSEFIFGPAEAAGVGPPTDAAGNPFSFWMRDSRDPNDRGRQIMARVFEAYFSSHLSDDGGRSPRKARQGFDPEGAAGDEQKLREATAEFDIASNERLVFGESFSDDSQFTLESMAVGEGVAFSTSDKHGAQARYEFKRPLEISEGDVAVYWAFRSNSEAGAEEGKLQMSLDFATPSPANEESPVQLALEVRPRASCVLSVKAETQGKTFPEMIIEAPGKTFGTIAVVEKFRLLLRWLGGDRVVVEPFWWDRKTERWEKFRRSEAEGRIPVALELSLKNDLLERQVIKSIQFQPYSVEAKLDTVVVTARAHNRR